MRWGRSARPLRAVVTLAVTCAVPAVGRAEVLARPGSLEREVKFRAREMELTPEREALELAGDVVVEVDRYRLTSDRLVLERTPRGVAVEGEGEVAFCQCPHPPVTLGFQGALAAPPGDLLLEQPTVRLLGVPVFWLPYLWLRSAGRFGLLPPELAYRGADGAFAASGLHVPLGAHGVDLMAGGYLEGGVEVRARHVGPSASTAVRVDRRDETLLAVEARGALPADGGGVAWAASALRGERAMGGPGELADVALRQDRAAIVAHGSGDVLGAAVLVGAEAPRGAALADPARVGPGALLAVRSPLGPGSSARADVRVATVESGGGEATSRLEHDGELRAAFPTGPLLVEGELRSRAALHVHRLGQGSAAEAAFGLTIGAPFFREFGHADGAVEHWAVPFVSAWLGAADVSGEAGPALLRSGPLAAALGGFRTTLGESQGRRRAASAELRGGLAGEPGESAARVVTARIAAGGPLVAARVESLAARSTSGVQDAAESGGEVLVGRVQLGRADGAVAAAHLEGQRGRLGATSRLLGGGWDAPASPWLGAPGWSTGGTLGVPLAAWLRALAAADYDVSSATWLGGRGALAYAHTCGCLAASLWAGSRLGRRGPDVWLTVDLLP